MQIPLQYFGFIKLLNGEKSKLCILGDQIQKERAQNNKNIKAVVSDIESIKQYCDSKGLLSMLGRCIAKTNAIEKKGNSYAMDVCTLLEYIAIILKSFGYIYIVILFVTGRATVGDMIYLNLINDLYFGAISDVINIQVNLRDLHSAFKFIEEEVDRNTEKDGNIELENVTKISGEIENVEYNEDILIQKGKFDFEIGDIIAIMGESGCGKSTFVKILNKFIYASGIKVNNHDII